MAIDDSHTRPEGLDDAGVEALGKLSEALECIEQARGMLYGFHRLTGTADFAAGDAADLFREAGQHELAERIEAELVGRNVLEGRWTFQVVEEYDQGYYADIVRLEREAREQLGGGKRHLYEAELKEQRRTGGRRHHERRPEDGPTGEDGPAGKE